jgi:hypothetical protein
MLLNGLLHLQSARHVSGTYMPIIRSSRLYLYCNGIWCVMPWLLVVGGQVQGSRLCVWDEGSCSSRSDGRYFTVWRNKVIFQNSKNENVTEYTSWKTWCRSIQRIIVIQITSDKLTANIL